ncbi:MAG: FtsX-like permease family protein [Gemmatimonadota bacterium]
MPDAPLSNERTLDALVAESLASRRVAALLLGCVGTYGLAAYGVVSRRREFAVRIAIGARRASVMRLVIGEGARLVAVGIVVGVAGALALSRAIRGLLFEEAETDPLALIGAPFLLAVKALAVGAIPAWPVTRIDPNA